MVQGMGSSQRCNCNSQKGWLGGPTQLPLLAPYEVPIMRVIKYYLLIWIIGILLISFEV